VDVEKAAFDVAAVPRPGPEALWKEPEKTVIVSPSRDHTVELPPTPLVPVRNGEYVRQLVSWAVQSGVRMRTGASVSGPVIEDGFVTGVTVSEGGSVERISASITADCTGIAGVVRKATPAGWRLADTIRPADTVLARREIRSVDRTEAAAAVKEGKLADRVRTDRTGAHGAYSVESFYLDIEGGFADILLGIKPSEGLPSADERFAELVGEMGFVKEKVFGDGGPIPIRRPLDALAGDGLVVLGDSACQVIPISGSGTASALIAADIASSAVSRALGEGRSDRSALWQYCREFQSGRGALLTYYDVLRNFTDTIESSDIEWLIARGVMTAEEITSGLVPRVFQPRPSSMVQKVLRGYARPGLLLGFAGAGLKAQKVMKLFRRYPERYSETEVESWAEALPRYP
jgi:flavin-dependent dehydrogenase